MIKEKEKKDWEKEFDEAVAENYRGQDPYFPDWEGVKSFIRSLLSSHTSKTFMKNQQIKAWAIYWRDAHTWGDWDDENGAKEFGEKSFNEPNVSFGRILIENKKYIIVCASMTKTKQLIGDMTMIPKSLVIKKILLREIDY